MTKFTTSMKALLAGSAVAVLMGSGAYAQIDTAIDVAKRSTAQAAQAQQQIDQLDDQADSAVREYRAVLQQIESLKLFLAQQDVFLQSQQDEIASLENQIGRVEEVKQSITPMMLRMTVELEDFINSDVPFQQGMRLARIDRIKENLETPGVAPADIYRQILNAYDIEMAYGQGLDSWKGDHPTEANVEVDYLRYGRLSYIYMTSDESELKVWNQEAGAWEDLPSSYTTQVRNAIRVANGQAAAELLVAPVYK